MRSKAGTGTPGSSFRPGAKSKPSRAEECCQEMAQRISFATSLVESPRRESMKISGNAHLDMIGSFRLCPWCGKSQGS